MRIRHHPAAAYVSGFLVLLILLALGRAAPVLAAPAFRVAVLALVVALFSRRVLDWRLSSPAGSLLVGLGVFLLWIAPDLFWPGYRSHWLFQNPLTGRLGVLDEPARSDALFLVFRTLQAVVVVPIVEELFWRGWLMRWLIDADFERVRLGSYTPWSFWLTAALFASEHGPHWDVAFAAGLAYNAWMIRTRRLADCILAHAATNAALCAYVIGWGKFEYWP
jgi:CAAX prenyl protease-like protein